jgi:hypothetical protein
LNQWHQDLFKGDIVKTPRQILDQFIVDMEAAQGFPITNHYRGHLEDVLAWNAQDLNHDNKLCDATFHNYETQIRQPQPINEAA